MALPTIFDHKNVSEVHGKRLVRLTANGAVVLPAGILVRRIYFRNRTANAVTGAIRVWSITAGAFVVAAQAVGANAVASVLASIESYSTAVQTLTIEAVTAWNGADVDVLVCYDEITTRNQPNQNNVQS